MTVAIPTTTRSVYGPVMILRHLLAHLSFDWTGKASYDLLIVKTIVYAYHYRMPICTCGCNQDITCRTIKNHLRGHTVPRLVTAAAKACRTLKSTVSPCRLNLSKKLRSSRRYFPSSPTSAVNEELDVLMSNGIGAEDGNVSEGGEEDIVVEEADVSRAINAALEGIWSGLHHVGDDTDEEYDDNENNSGEGEENATGDEVAEGAYDDWDDGELTLSALDMLGEDFERESVANGEFLLPFYA